MGRVSVQILSVLGPIGAELAEACEPTCRLTVGDGSAETTLRASGTCLQGRVEIAWQREEVLEIAVGDHCDHDESCFASCHVSLRALQGCGGFRGELVAYRRCTEQHGALLVDLASQGGLAGREVQLQLVPSRRYKNHIAGTVISLGDGDDPGTFTTCHVGLRHVATVFGSRVQCDYDEEHARIFADNVQGGLIRAGIQAQHAALYREGLRPDWLRLEGRRTVEDVLATGADFFRLIGNGVRGARRRVFTFALVDDGLFFSETGALFAKDLCSKHAVHANAEPAVRYAGTFRVCEAPGEGEVLVLDNDSGTYRPSADDLAPLLELLETNLPGLRVRGLSVLLPQPENTKAWRGPNEVKENPESVYAGKWVWQP